jgi:integrase
MTATCFTPVQGSIDGRPWRHRPITFDGAPLLARHLNTACDIIIGYLSGQRPGETLNLRRGCIDTLGSISAKRGC